MSGILQKSSRKARRVQVDVTCTVTVFGSKHGIVVELLDLSTSGVGFASRGPQIPDRSTVQVDFTNLQSAPISMRGKILTHKEVPKGELTKIHSKKAKTRYSVKFELPLSEKQFVDLLSSFDLSSPEILRKAR